MAFSTEFVMGAGGSVEEIPVSMSGGSSGVSYPLATVDAGTGAWVWVDGPLSPGGSGNTTSPELEVGSHIYRAIGDRAGGGGYFTGTVNVAIRSRTSLATTFSGTVYVIRV